MSDYPIMFRDFLKDNRQESMEFQLSGHPEGCGCSTCDETNYANNMTDIFWWEEDGGLPLEQYLDGTYIDTALPYIF